MLGPYRAVSWRFTVDCDDPVLTAALRRALGTLEDGSATPVGAYALRAPTPEDPGTLSVDGEELLRSTSPRLLYQTVLWHVNRGVVAASADHVLLHAAAAEADGRAVLLCGQSEAGKTTLVAGLVRAGLRYLTDEATAIRPADLGVTPFPKALSVDSGSWPLLPELSPDLPEGAESLVGEQWQVPPTRIRPDALSSGAVPRVVVLNRYVPGAPTELVPMSRAGALVEVLQQTFEVQRQRRRDMEVLAEVLRGCACYRLTTGSLDEAVAAVLGVLRAA